MSGFKYRRLDKAEAAVRRPKNDRTDHGGESLPAQIGEIHFLRVVGRSSPVAVHCLPIASTSLGWGTAGTA